MTAPIELPDIDGVAIRVGDRVMVRNLAGGHLADDRGNERTFAVRALDEHLGAQVHDGHGLVWYGSRGLTKVESIWSANDCHWTGEHPADCRHQPALALQRRLLGGAS